MKLKLTLSRTGVSFGLGLAFASVLTAGVGSSLLWRVMEAENRAYIQQSIGDTTLLLAIHFRTAFEHFVARVSEVGEGQLRLVLHPIDNSHSIGLSDSGVGTTDTDPGIIDVSLWKYGLPGKRSTGIDMMEDEEIEHDASAKAAPPAYEPRRAFLALNSRYPDLSGELIQHLQATEATEKTLVQPAFQGHTVVTLSPGVEGLKALAIAAVPLGHGVVNEIVVAHIRLEQFQQVLSGNAMVNVALVDGFGNILAHSDEKSVGKRAAAGMANSPLFHTMHASNLPSGQLTFTDERGVQFYGGYSRVGVGQLAVLATVSEAEAGATLKITQKQTLFFIAACFVFFLGAGYLLSTQKELLPTAQTKRSANLEKEEADVNPDTEEPKRVIVTILHGSLRHLNHIIDSATPIDAVDVINDYFTVAASAVKGYGGIFERDSEKSFIGIWGAPVADGTEIWRALRCSLEVRRNLNNFNEARKVNGQKTISFGMGVHTGAGLGARLGNSKHMRYTVAGEVVNCARSLNDLSVSAGVDLLISQDAWQQSEAKFVGESLGETKLTKDTGLTGIFSLSGYRDEQGQVVTVEAPNHLDAPTTENGEIASLSPIAVKEKKSLKWLVNNGSQIVGPLTPKEIALRLFAQELDFDCECWEEGTGNSAQIKDSGIFSGSDDNGASLWIFDGETIHGPISQGFLKTAMGHGAIQGQVFICEGSTVTGWKPLSQWDITGSTSLASGEGISAKDPLHISLSPPNRKSMPKVDSEKVDQSKKAA